MQHPQISQRAVLLMMGAAAIFCGAALSAQGSAQGMNSKSPPTFKRTPGSWQVSIVIEKLEGEGMTDQVRQTMQTMMDKQSEIKLCLTADQAKAEDFVDTMLNSNKNHNCKNIREDITENTANIVAECVDPAGKKFSMALEGVYSPTKVDMLIKSENAPSRNGPVTMNMRTVSKWTGSCTPGQKTIY